MTRQESKKYILAHPTDDEAIRELFMTRRNPNTKVYPYMPYEEVESIFKSKLNQSEL